MERKLEKFDNTLMLIRRRQEVTDSDRANGFKWLWHGLRVGSLKHPIPASDAIIQAYAPAYKVNE